MNRWGIIGKKIINIVLVLIGISMVSFTLSVLAPGDPAIAALDQDGVLLPTEEQVAIMRQTLGLNLPWYQQYGMWLGKVLQGDLGISYKSGISVSEELLRRLPPTLMLSLAALVVAALGGIMLGLAGVIWRNTVWRSVINFVTNSFLAMPGFLMALLLIFVVSEVWQLLPTSGLEEGKSLVLPTFVLSFTMMALTGRFLQEKLAEELNKQYCVVARARGLSRTKILLFYAFPNAFVPVLALLGNYFGNILGGSVVVESIFAIPGLGSLALEAIRFRDYPVLQAYVLLMGCIFIGIYVIIDLCLWYCNPIIKTGRDNYE